jgi:flagellar hook protein FlgE
MPGNFGLTPAFTRIAVADPRELYWHDFCFAQLSLVCGPVLTVRQKESRMSLFGALTTAVSGLSAQSAAFSNISDNIANSQTVGYKGVDTDFVSYLTDSTATQNASGSVATLPQYTNSVQGPIDQSTDPLGLAISGQGFFAVSQSSGTPNAAGTGVDFNSEQYYTRAGDFSVNSEGYLVNGSGNYLDGWAVNPSTGAANETALSPIQISQSTFQPVATSKINLSADLPATPAANTPVTSQINVYDALGTQHTLTLNYAQTNPTTNPNQWTVTITSPDNTPTTTIGSAELTFGSTSGNAVPPGTIGSITNATGALSGSTYTAGSAATLTLSPNLGQGAQPITLNLGTYGGSTGLTQYAGTAFNLLGITQNGVPQGSFSNVSVDTKGSVIVNYTNGQSQTVAQIPITTFNAPDALQSESGQAYAATNQSGAALTNPIGSNGAGSLVVGSTEGSNVDIATEFTKLITAQEAYSANAKVVTTADQLATTTINMKQ